MLISRTFGVYLIVNLANSKVYVGSTTRCFSDRWSRHRRTLRAGVHENRKLQNAWNKYGENSFEFRAFEIHVEKDKVIPAEQKAIDQFNSYKSGYNICPVAGTCKGKMVTQRQKKKISKRANSPETIHRNRLANQKTHRQPAMRKKASERAKKQMSNIAHRTKVLDAMRAYWNDSVNKRKAAERGRIQAMSRNMGRLLKEWRESITPEEKAAIDERRRATARTEENRRSAAERAKRQFASEEARRQVGEKSRLINGTPEARKAASEKSKKQFSDPAARERAAEKQRQYWASLTDEQKEAHRKKMSEGLRRRANVIADLRKSSPAS